MTADTGVLVTLGLFCAGCLVTTGRLLERMSVVQRDLRRLEEDIGKIQAVLYTTVGGRRAIRPIRAGELAEGESDR